MPQSVNSSETTPVLHGDNPIKKAKDKKDAVKATLIAKAHKDQQRFDRCMKCGMCCVLGTFAIFVILIIKYFVDGYEKRDEVDHRESIVYERWKDYKTHGLVNCSSDHPCEGWTCEYVKEHFHRTPDECQYDDWMDQVMIVLSILTFFVICACLCD
tara:strand:+ start:689 stop:1156 length:468 start_codon:yes stop_codon:yes gene_type:complete